MEVNNVKLAAVAVKRDQFPDDSKPEIVFVGKSNVGKSSLINTMINRKALARTSQNPGKTRTINFYDVEDMLYFVDLPGYGYAKISRSQSEKWGAMIEGYLLRRTQIKLIVMLVDIRHEPSAGDRMMYEWLRHYGYTMVIVATKADKIKKSQLQKQIAMIKREFKLKLESELEAPPERVVPFSSETREGKETLWEILENAISD